MSYPVTSHIGRYEGQPLRLPLAFAMAAILFVVSSAMIGSSGTSNLAYTSALVVAATSTPATTSLAPISLSNAAQLKQVAQLGRGTVSQVAWSPDGTMLAVAGSQGIWFYAASALDDPVTLLPSTQLLTSIAFSPDAKLLAAGGDDGTTDLWDVQTGQIQATLNGDGTPARKVAFSPDGKLLAVAENQLVLWDVQTRKIRLRLRAVLDIAFSPDGKLLAACAGDGGQIWLWNVQSGKNIAILSGTMGVVLSVAFSPDGKLLAAGGEMGRGAGTVQLWDVQSQRSKALLTESLDYVERLAFSPDGKLLATGSSQSQVLLWDVETRRIKATLVEVNILGHRVRSLAFSPDGHLLASSSTDNAIRVSDVQVGQVKTTLSAHTDWVYDLAFSPDSQLLAAGSFDGLVSLWDVQTGRLKVALSLFEENNWATSIAFSPDGNMLAAGSHSGWIQLCEMRNLQCHVAFQLRAEVSGLAFSPDGKLLAAAGFASLQLWDVSAGKVRAVLSDKSPIESFGSVAFSSDSKTLVVGTAEELGDIEFWDVQTGQFKDILEGSSGLGWRVAVSPNGKLLAGGGEGVKLWNMQTGQATVSFAVKSGLVTSVAFSPDSQLLAVTTENEIGTLWDVQSGKNVFAFTQPDPYLKPISVAISPDGKLMASGGASVLLWGVPFTP